MAREDWDDNEDSVWAVDMNNLGAEVNRLLAWPCELLDNGFGVVHRILSGTSHAMLSGRIQFDYFTAPETATRNTITKYTGATPNSGTAPTTIKMGVYSVAANGDLTRLASTANDTTLFGVAFGVATKTLDTPVNFVRGNRYAQATLIVTTGTIANLWGPGTLGGGMLGGVTPVWAMQINSQTDLLASYAAGGIFALATAYTYSRFTTV